VNFYKRFIGDIQAKTGNLSLAEFGAYDRLLDHYYSTEEPLPIALDECYRICRAMSPEERAAVDKVLSKFFTATTEGFWQEKADEMIADALPKIEAARNNGKLGGRPKKEKLETHEKPTGFENKTQEEPNAKASQSQTLSSLRSERDAPKALSPRAKKTETTLQAYLDVCKAEARKPIPPDHAIRAYCTDAGITPEMLQVAWLVFKDDFATGKNKDKKQKDWPAHFANSVKRRWYGLWVANTDADAQWTSNGLQEKRVLETRLRKTEPDHAGA
jgi:uncharacterized protein YdaU (DUF1376 family)